MPIISAIGRRSWKTRSLFLGIYLLLIAGSITMVYPFLLMVAGSTQSQVDSRDVRVVPRYLQDETVLYRKHLEGLFNERLSYLKDTYDSDLNSFDKAEIPVAVDSARVSAWERFLTEQAPPAHSYFIGYMHTPQSRTFPSALRSFKQRMVDRFDGEITGLNHELRKEFVNWNAFQLRPEYYLQRRSSLLSDPFYSEVQQFKSEQPLGLRYYFSIEGFFKSHYLRTRYVTLADLNKAWGTQHANWNALHLTRSVPADASPAEKADWEDFVRSILNQLWLQLDAAAETEFQRFLQAKYGGVQVLNRKYETDYASFDRVPLPLTLPGEGMPRSDWSAFVGGWKDAETGKIYQPEAGHLRIDAVDFQYADWLQQHEPEIFARGVAMPQRAFHYQWFQGRQSELRKEFSTRNYLGVLDYMLVHGRGFWNTAVYCFLSVLIALIVNPLAAYALSRYKLVNGYRLLLLMLLTMAFPPMVTQIPVFLMLRDLGLLNTFAALLLPGMAHGYSIFLLKGFFDSLPRDLYESAEIDGAGEWTMFWQITMSLSKPVLAVVGLSAFTAAYSNFLFALLICQDERMWTIMVWLFQLRQISGQGVVYASLILAAIPTFVVFVFCQNIIMRGIVVPTEK